MMVYVWVVVYCVVCDGSLVVGLYVLCGCCQYGVQCFDIVGCECQFCMVCNDVMVVECGW